MNVEFRIRNERPEHVVDVWLEQCADGIVVMAGDYAIAALMNDGTLHRHVHIDTPGIQTDADGRIVCTPLGASRKAILEEVLLEWDKPDCLLREWLHKQIAACGR